MRLLGDHGDEKYWFRRGALSGAVFGLAFILSAVAAAIINPLPYIFQNGTTADATQVNADLAQIVANVNANALPGTTNGLVPVNAIMAFYLGVCPSGWVLADGANATPDLRGYFVRGLDTGGAIDPGRVINTTQQDQLQDHVHTYQTGTGTNSYAGGGTFAFNGTTGVATSAPTSGNHGAETRPKNVALRYCMKQ